MAVQRKSSLGVVSSVAFGSVSLAAMLGCAGVLGIEDATCDAEFDARCASTTIAPVFPAGAGGGAGNGAGGSGIGNGGTAGNGTGGSAMATGGAGAGGAGGSAMAAAGAAGAPGAVPGSLCQRYCDTVASACAGAFEQYASPAACQAVCELLDPGTPGDTDGNSVECRLTRAQLADTTGEPGNYCFSAGPGGGGVCGNDCEGFCTLMSQKCTLMGSYEQCLPTCLQVPDLSPDTTYDTSIQSGDSIQCRLFHVTASTLDPVTHCNHAAGVALCAIQTAPTPPPP